MSTSTERPAWLGSRAIPALVAALLILAIASLALARDTLSVRYERDVSRVVFNDNTELLEDVRRRAGLASDTLSRALASGSLSFADAPYIVVSIADHRLWYRSGDSILFTAPVTTGSGKVLEGRGEDRHWKLETPRGRLTVLSKEKDPVWVAPDWHYAELAQTRGLGIRRLHRGQRIATADGGRIAVAGSDLVQISPSGVIRILAGDGDELIVDGNVIVPPFGTNQRKYADVLGTRRFNLGDGYAIHGTNAPELIGRSVSHGCIRLRNQDIESLYEIVQIGTPVFVY